MKRYERGDDATFYFVIHKQRGKEKYIKAWTDNKEMLKFYMDFHETKNFSVKKISDRIESIQKLVEENLNDEITIGHVRIGDKHGEQLLVALPVTETEMQFIREEDTSYMATTIDYSLINNLYPTLKKKYQHALEKILLIPIADFNVNNKFNEMVGRIFLNNVKILHRSFPDEFL